jgi:hypothetical protein
LTQIKAFLRCIAVAMEQGKDKIWVKKVILQPIKKSLNEFYKGLLRITLL